MFENIGNSIDTASKLGPYYDVTYLLIVTKILQIGNFRYSTGYNVTRRGERCAVSSFKGKLKNILVSSFLVKPRLQLFYQETLLYEVLFLLLKINLYRFQKKRKTNWQSRHYHSPKRDSGTFIQCEIIIMVLFYPGSLRSCITDNQDMCQSVFLSKC